MALALVYFAHRNVQWEGGNVISVSFEMLSFLITVCSVIFVQRMSSDLLLVFKLALVLSCLQVGWHGKVWYERVIMEEKTLTTEIKQNQLPLGALFFVVAWASDRVMLRNLTTAENAVKALERKQE